jgi:quercetin dioxygenase-like cupin family protein
MFNRAHLACDIESAYGNNEPFDSRCFHHQGRLGDSRAAFAPQLIDPEPKPGGGTIACGRSYPEHYHARTEEIYYITHGNGRMRIEGELRDVVVGDAIVITPGQRHKLWNIGTEPLRLLCCCAPAYEHTDTIITEQT